MGLSVRGVSATVRELRREEERTNKALLRSMRRSARKIQDLARQFAPVDEGNLEEAIVVAEDQVAYTGRNRKVTYVGVDPSLLGEGFSRYGHRYDIFMHEGTYNLGPRSQMKQAGVPGRVGPKYLERAVEELEDEIQADYEATVKRTLGG